MSYRISVELEVLPETSPASSGRLAGGGKLKAERILNLSGDVRRIGPVLLTQDSDKLLEWELSDLDPTKLHLLIIELDDFAWGATDTDRWAVGIARKGVKVTSIGTVIRAWGLAGEYVLEDDASLDVAAGVGAYGLGYPDSRPLHSIGDIFVSSAPVSFADLKVLARLESGAGTSTSIYMTMLEFKETPQNLIELTQ